MQLCHSQRDPECYKSFTHLLANSLFTFCARHDRKQKEILESLFAIQKPTSQSYYIRRLKVIQFFILKKSDNILGDICQKNIFKYSINIFTGTFVISIRQNLVSITAQLTQETVKLHGMVRIN